MFSFALTIVAVWIGWVVDGSAQQFTISGFAYHVRGTITKLLVTNLAFDAVTVAVTYRVLNQIRESRPRKTVTLLAANIFIAYVLAVLCGATCIWLIDPHRPIFLAANQSIRGIHAVLSFRRGPSDEITLGLYSATTLVPISAAFFGFLIVAVAKASLSSSKWFVQYFLERATDVKKAEEIQVFGLTGWVFSVFVAVAGALAKVVTLISAQR